MRALLLFVTALLIGIAPASALAHDGVSHGDGEQVAVGSPAQAWSPICPPGSGHVCGCGNLSLCEGGAKPVVVSRCTVSFLAARFSYTALAHEAQAWASVQFSPGLPRAPPQFS